MKLSTGPASFSDVGVFHHPRTGERQVLCMGKDSHQMIVGTLRFPLPSLGNHSPDRISDTDQDALERVRECMARLVICTELEMSDPERVAKPTASKRGPKTGTTAPSGVHRLLREVKVDCRASITAYISGERSAAPSVQTLVRGHFQRYHVGKGGAGIVWRQKEPYWKGPEDAPVAVRPHRLGDKD